MALISITVVFAAHVMHSMTYFRSMDVYPKILMEVNKMVVLLCYWIRPC